jgi:hypothetical protein
LTLLKWKIEFGEPTQVVEEYLEHNFKKEISRLDDEELDSS